MTRYGFQSEKWVIHIGYKFHRKLQVKKKYIYEYINRIY